MAKRTRVDWGQFVMVSEFVFDFDDTMIASDGLEKPLRAAGAFPVFKLPRGAVIVDGELVVETAGATATTWTLSLGDAGSPTRYLAAKTLMAAGRSALAPTGAYVDGDILATIAATGSAATAGRVALRVLYAVPGKAHVVN